MVNLIIKVILISSFFIMIKIFQNNRVMNHLYKDELNEIYTSKFKLELNKCNNYVKLIHLSSGEDRVKNITTLSSYI